MMFINMVRGLSLYPQILFCTLNGHYQQWMTNTGMILSVNSAINQMPLDETQEASAFRQLLVLCANDPADDNRCDDLAHGYVRRIRQMLAGLETKFSCVKEMLAVGYVPMRELLPAEALAPVIPAAERPDLSHYYLELEPADRVTALAINNHLHELAVCFASELPDVDSKYVANKTLGRLLGHYLLELYMAKRRHEAGIEKTKRYLISPVNQLLAAVRLWNRDMDGVRKELGCLLILFATAPLETSAAARKGAKSQKARYSGLGQTVAVVNDSEIHLFVAFINYLHLHHRSFFPALLSRLGLPFYLLGCKLVNARSKGYMLSNRHKEKGAAARAELVDDIVTLLRGLEPSSSPQLASALDKLAQSLVFLEKDLRQDRNGGEGSWGEKHYWGKLFTLELGYAEQTYREQLGLSKGSFARFHLLCKLPTPGKGKQLSEKNKKYQLLHENTLHLIRGSRHKTLAWLPQQMLDVAMEAQQLSGAEQG